MPADNSLRRHAMTFTTIAALLVFVANAGFITVLWHKRINRGREHPGSFRSNIALSALLATTYSSIAYMVFAILCLFHVRTAFTGQQPIGLLALQGGLATAAMGSVGGCFGRSWERVGIVSAALVSGGLWVMAAFASKILG